MHALPILEVPLYLVGLADNRTHNHTIRGSSRFAGSRLGDIPVAFLRHVTKVNPETVHVASIPLMLLNTILASVVTQRGTQTLTSRHWTSIRSIGVRWWLKTMRVEHVQDVVVRTMIQLLLGKLIHVLRRQILPVLVMALGQCRVFDSLDADYLRVTSVKWRGCHELVTDLHALRTRHVNGLQCVPSPCCGPLWMGTEAGVCESQILSTTISCDEPRAGLARRTMCIFHTNGSSRPSFVEGCAVQPMHQGPWNRLLQNGMRLLEVALDDLNLCTLHVARRIRLQEASHVLPKVVVAEVRMKKTHPQHGCCLPRHLAIALPRRHWHWHWGRLCGIVTGQGTVELRTGIRARTSELDNELRQNLVGFCDHIASGTSITRDPHMVAVLCCRISSVSRCDAQCQSTDEHVIPTSAVADRDRWILGEILPGAMDLPDCCASLPLVEARVHDGQHVGWSCPMETLKDVGLSTQDFLESLATLFELVSQQWVVDFPGR